MGSPPKMFCSIGTPEKIKSKDWVESQESGYESRQLFIAPDHETVCGVPCWSWARCLVAAVMVSVAYVTNPGENKDGFRKFLQVQRLLPILHRAAEAVGLVTIDVWNVGIAAFGQESSRFFVGFFDHWIELPGGWSEDRDVDVLVLTFFACYAMWHGSSLTVTRHCTASFANLRGGRLWALAAAQLSHAQLEHLLISVVSNISIGPQAHAVLGRHRFCALFFIGGGCAI